MQKNASHTLYFKIITRTGAGVAWILKFWNDDDEVEEGRQLTFVCVCRKIEEKTMSPHTCDVSLQ
jgi:hypothetical protein